jgi:hypothetical protein
MAGSVCSRPTDEDIPNPDIVCAGFATAVFSDLPSVMPSDRLSVAATIIKAKENRQQIPYPLEKVMRTTNVKNPMSWQRLSMPALDAQDIHPRTFRGPIAASHVQE